ncbi:MAG: long-chain fatty acid--CoA ligase [Thermomicrobiales bacterium]
MPKASTLAGLISDVAASNPTKTAITFQDQPIPYAHLNGMIELAANALAARGIGQGDRVAIMMPNIPQFVVAYYAIARLGGTVVPLNLLYKADEVGYMLNDSGAKAIIIFEMFYPQAAEGIKAAPAVEHVIYVSQGAAPEGTTHWAALMDKAIPQRGPVEVKPDDVAVICYTSGTTGRSKGAMLTHRNFISNCEQCGLIPNYEYTAEDSTLLVLPLFHIYAMNVGMNASFWNGGSIILMTRFEPVPVLEAIQKYRPTFFYGAPPMYVAWINTPGVEQYDLSSIRFSGSGAAALPMQVLNRFKELTGVTILEGYGLTETSPVTHSNAASPQIKPGTIGWPIPGVEAKLVDESDQEVPLGSEGEIVVRGENIMVGYWNNKEASDEALHGGWFHTGDIATIDGEGYYTIVDRKKDMINAGGFKVWPREVEELLYKHPAVQEAAVVPMPDPYAGERPVAYVSLKQGQAATEQELIGYCKERLASFKAPVRVEFRDDLPKLPTGKVLRRVLREDARQLQPM